MIKRTNGIFIDFCTYLFIFLFLFSNLLTRVMNYYGMNINLNTLIYIILSILLMNLFFRISRALVKKYYWLLILIIFFTINIFNITYCNLASNFASTKDIIVPFFISFVALYFRNQIDKLINYINKLFIVFISYGVIQEIVWYKFNSLSNLLPWDDSYIQEMLEQGVENVFQTGGLLRFFGVMNAFVEYQIVAIVLISFLYLYRYKIRNKVLYYVNFFLCSCFLIFSLERSPIIMFLIIMFFLNYKKVFDRLFLIKTIPIAVILIIGFNLFSSSFKNNQIHKGLI